MEVVGVALAAAALAIIFIVEWLKRPRLEIAARPWRAPGPVPWVFAAVEIRNKPIFRPLRALLVRDSAKGCEVSLEFRTPGQKHLAISEVRARWSHQPEPIRSVPVATSTASQPGASSPSVQFVPQYDPALVPQTLRFDVPAGDVGYEVGIAILRADGTAHAWGADSYAFQDWKNPAWALGRQIYEVTVRARASGITKTRRFRLNNLAPNFATFSDLEMA
jgi:hypothetical protein